MVKVVASSSFLCNENSIKTRLGSLAKFGFTSHKRLRKSCCVLANSINSVAAAKGNTTLNKPSGKSKLVTACNNSLNESSSVCRARFFASLPDLEEFTKNALTYNGNTKNSGVFGVKLI